MDRKIFLSKLTNDSTEEACWIWRADVLALIEKGYRNQDEEITSQLQQRTVVLGETPVGLQSTQNP